MRAPCGRSYGGRMTPIAASIEHRTPGAPAVRGVAADFLRGVRPVLWLGESHGHASPPTHLLRGAHGRVVEIGAGTGLNVAHYPDGVAELVLIEPEPGMRRRLARRLHRQARVARIVDAPAEHLPLADASVDTVVSTLVLCTVDDPERALREIARALRPDGQLLFVEHVRASSRFLAGCQDKLLEPWRRSRAVTAAPARPWS